MLKGKAPLLIALLLGLLAGAVSYLSIKHEEAHVRQGWNLIPVVVANRNVLPGTTIDRTMIAERPVPSQFVTSSVIRPGAAHFVIGQKVLVSLQPGDTLLWSQFANARKTEHLSAKVQRRTRAVTISAAGTTAVGGWVRPNDHVDIVGTFKDPQSNNSVAITLMQNIIVLATGKITGTTDVNLIPESQRTYSNVTLEVLPEEAEILTLAEQLGSLTLTLRNPNDVDTIDDSAHTDIKTLLSGVRTKELEKIRRKTIQVIRNGSEAATPAH